MPDDACPPCDNGWSFKRWGPKDWLILIGGLCGLLGIGRANLAVHDVQQKQDEHIEKSDKSRNEIERAAGPNLKASWDYLQQKADEEPKNKLAQDTAANAKAVYEDWLKIQRDKP